MAAGQRPGTRVWNRPGPKVTWTLGHITPTTRRRLDRFAERTQASLGLLVQEIIRHAHLDPATGAPALPSEVLIAAAEPAETVGSLTVQTEPEMRDRLRAIADAVGTRNLGRAMNMLVAAVEIEPLTGQPAWWPQVLRDLGYISDEAKEELPLNIAS